MKSLIRTDESAVGIVGYKMILSPPSWPQELTAAGYRVYTISRLLNPPAGGWIFIAKGTIADKPFQPAFAALQSARPRKHDGPAGASSP